MGKQFVEQNSDKMGLADSLKAAFGQGEPNEIEANIAQILGKNSNQFTSADYAIIGQALSGTPNQYSLPGATQTDAAKLKQISDAIDEIQSGQFADMSLPKPKPTRDDRGLGGLSMPDITMGKIGDSNDDPPVRAAFFRRLVAFRVMIHSSMAIRPVLRVRLMTASQLHLIHCRM